MAMPKLKKGQWSRKCDRCIECGTSNRKHAAYGLCYKCYCDKHERHDNWNCKICGSNTDKRSKEICLKCYKRKNRVSIHKNWNCEVCGTNTNKETKKLCGRCHRNKKQAIIHLDWSCKVCGTNTNRLTTKLCRQCYTKNKKSKTHKNWNCEICETNKDKHSKKLCGRCYRKYYNKRPAMYKTWYTKLHKYHKIKKAGKYIKVQCKYNECNRWFIPNNIQIKSRLSSINGNGRGFGESNFYCSNECKNNCDLYGKNPKDIIKQDALIGNEWEDLKLLRYSPEYKEFVKKSLERANYKCERCGSEEDLMVHHEKPVKTHPHEIYDTITAWVLCENCHKETHSKERNECTYNDLSKKICRVIINNNTNKKGL